VGNTLPLGLTVVRGSGANGVLNVLGGVLHVTPPVEFVNLQGLSQKGVVIANRAFQRYPNPMRGIDIPPPDRDFD
jgi:hypothetical protein